MLAPVYAAPHDRRSPVPNRIPCEFPASRLSHPRLATASRGCPHRDHRRPHHPIPLPKTQKLHQPLSPT